jgi:hypothetical protein
MPKLTRFQTSFEYGEISPLLLARVDIPAYNKATKKQENFVSLLHGGAAKRRGTLFVGAVANEAQKARFIPFVYSNSVRFMLVLNGGVMQFIKNGAFVETSPGVRYSVAIPYTEAQLPDVQFAQSGNTMYLVHPAHFPRLLQRVTDTNWSFTNIPFTYGAISDTTFQNAFISFKIINGSAPFQVGSSFTIGTTAGAITSVSALNLGVTQVPSVGLATTGSNIALTGLLTIDSRVTIAGDRVLVKDQSTASQNGIYIAAAGAWARSTDSDAAGELNNSIVYVATGDINAGTWWKQTANVVTVGTSTVTYTSSTQPGNGQIAGVVSMPGSTTTETWTITCTLSSASRQEWSISGSVSGAAPAMWKTSNYPQSVSFFEQRLFFGGSPQFPQYIWGSAAGDYLNFTVGNRDSDGVLLQIAGNDYNAITHMVSARNLMPLTSSTEFSLAGPNNFAISGVSSNVIKDHTRHGSNNVRPMRIGREVVFLQRDGKKARAISYSVTEDANIAPDITIFAEHLTATATFTDMAFAADPDFIAWIVRSDGVLCSLTLAREFETTSWARHTTDGFFEAVGAVPGTSADDVFVVARRTINGSTRRYVEQFDYDTSNIAYMDAASFYSGASTSTIAGLSYLEGKQVVCVANGVLTPTLTVTSGSITLPNAATTVLVGLPFTAEVELLNPEFGDATASSQARASSVTDIIVRLQDTVNLKINDVVIPFRTTTMGFDSAVAPFTGDKRVKSIGWRSPNNIKLTSDTPTPCTILGVLIEAQVN